MAAIRESGAKHLQEVDDSDDESDEENVGQREQQLFENALKNYHHALASSEQLTTGLLNHYSYIMWSQTQTV